MKMRRCRCMIGGRNLSESLVGFCICLITTYEITFDDIHVKLARTCDATQSENEDHKLQLLGCTCTDSTDST